MEIVRELWNFISIRKKFYLIPVLLLLMIFGALIVLTQGTAVAPFVYTLF